MLDRVERSSGHKRKRLMMRNDHEGGAAGELVMLLFEKAEARRPSRRQEAHPTRGNQERAQRVALPRAAGVSPSLRRSIIEQI